MPGAAGVRPGLPQACLRSLCLAACDAQALKSTQTSFLVLIKRLQSSTLAVHLHSPSALITGSVGD